MTLRLSSAPPHLYVPPVTATQSTRSRILYTTGHCLHKWPFIPFRRYMVSSYVRPTKQMLCPIIGDSVQLNTGTNTSIYWDSIKLIGSTTVIYRLWRSIFLQYYCIHVTLLNQAQMISIWLSLIQRLTNMLCLSASGVTMHGQGSNQISKSCSCH